MTKIVTTAQMQALDRRAISESGLPAMTLMERAGAGVATHLENTFGLLRGKTITIFCGKGNNGGDGYVAARLLYRRHAKVMVYTLSPVLELSHDAARMYRQFIRLAGKSAVRPYTSKSQALPRAKESAVIIDALFGTGLSSEISGRYADAIDCINEAGQPVLAVDLPSGLHADTGAILGRAVCATLTVTLGLPKLGLYLNQGINLAGDIRIVDIGIPPAYVDAVESRTSLITGSFVRTSLPVRKPSSHKGTYGHAGIIAGSVGKTGAAAMAAKAALRVGAGLVTVATPSSVNDILEAKLLEAMTAPMPETKARTFSRAAFDRLTAFISAKSAVASAPDCRLITKRWSSCRRS